MIGQKQRYAERNKLNKFYKENKNKPLMSSTDIQTTGSKIELNSRNEMIQLMQDKIKSAGE